MRTRRAEVQPERHRAPPPQAQAPGPDELRRMIEEAAYYRAEKRGFAPGGEHDDWHAAEAEVLSRVRAMESRI
jgi:hypothetical protein